MFTHKPKNKAFVKGDLEVYNLLKTIQKSRQTISLSFDMFPHHSVTSLLEVHYDTKVLIFDEPNPQLSEKLISTKNEAEFSLKLEKLPVKFKSPFIFNYKKIELSDLYTPFPKEIFYPQRRNYYRLHTEYINAVSSTIFLASNRQLQCELINISLDGFCIRLPYSFTSMFHIKQLIDDIYIQLPNEKGFSVSAVIQNARIESNYSHIALGLQIQEQKTSIEKKIQQFILRTENI